VRPIPGFSGYFITDTGRVWSSYTHRWLLPQQNRHGHWYTHLRKNGISIFRFIHRLVLEAYVGPRSQTHPQCRHLDGNPSNNCLANLAWGTPAENVRDAVLQGMWEGKIPPPQIGEHNPHAKLNTGLVLEIDRLFQTGMYTLSELGRMFGVTATNIHDIVYHKTWRHLWKDAA
jgi:hypothetical protein